MVKKMNKALTSQKFSAIMPVKIKRNSLSRMATPHNKTTWQPRQKRNTIQRPVGTLTLNSQRSQQ
jgi:hypothetical protein